METVWIETKTDIDSVDWKGNRIHLKGVKAIQNQKTGKVRVYPSEVAKAEFRMLAEKHGLEPRDIASLAVIYVKPGPFKEGQVHYKYHLNKMLFYQWKNMERQGIGETFPHDEFEAARRGPVPKNLSDDLKRLEEKGIVKLRYKQWGKTPKQASLITELTSSGFVIAEKLWNQIPDPFKEVTLETKEEIFPLDPKTVCEKVHREFPEYRKTYIELDTD